jgi:hypothetical protein
MCIKNYLLNELAIYTINVRENILTNISIINTTKNM